MTPAIAADQFFINWLLSQGKNFLGTVWNGIIHGVGLQKYKMNNKFNKFLKFLH